MRRPCTGGLSRGRSRLDAVKRACAIGRRFPASLTLGTTLTATMTATALQPSWYDPLVRRVGVTWPDVAALQLWRVPTSSLVQQQTGIVWPIVALLPVLAAAELRFGSATTLATYALVDALGTVPVLAVLALSGAAGLSQAQKLADTPNLGSSAGLVGLLAALSATLGGRQRRLAASVLATGLACALLLDWDLADAQHAIAAIAGGAIGLRLSQRRGSARVCGARLGPTRAARRASPDHNA